MRYHVIPAKITGDQELLTTLNANDPPICSSNLPLTPYSCKRTITAAIVAAVIGKPRTKGLLLLTLRTVNSSSSIGLSMFSAGEFAAAPNSEIFRVACGRARLDGIQYSSLYGEIQAIGFALSIAFFLAAAASWSFLMFGSLDLLPVSVNFPSVSDVCLPAMGDFQYSQFEIDLIA